MKENGFTVQNNIGGIPTAFTATAGSGKPVIAIIGEFDALPGLSQKDIPTQSPVVEGGNGHACGHNLLGSASALAAVAVKEELAAKHLTGTVRFYGAPAEENGGGKIYMIYAGAFKDVDVALTWHPGDVNQVSMRSGLAITGGWFRFYGTASHAAAAPERGRSALDAGMIFATAVEFMREHVPQETRIHYVFTNGGGAANVVPPFVEMDLRARHPDSEVLTGIWERVMKCAQAGALATETRMEFELSSMSYSNLIVNDVLAQILFRNMKKVGGVIYTPEEQQFADTVTKSFGPPMKRPSPADVTFDNSEIATGGSTDVGDVSWVVPTQQFNTATWIPGTIAHTWQAAAAAGMSIGRKGMVNAARIMALSAMDLYESPAQVQAAKAAFEKRLAGRHWTSRIPAGSMPPLLKAAK